MTDRVPDSAGPDLPAGRDDETREDEVQPPLDEEHRRSGSNGASRAVDAFMREARERFVGASRHERNELAGTVMACAAADAPDVVREFAA